ncbi:MAG: hypothetical protein WCD47_19390 [Candidatus Sulfotelmatobacter sp.]
METLTRLVTDSLARHGFDRPIDPRRLQWSRWFRCDSTHSLLVVPSKPGIFAIAEEVGASVARAPSPATAADVSRNIHLGTAGPEFPIKAHVGTANLDSAPTKAHVATANLDSAPTKAHVGTAALGCPPERSSAPLPASPPLGGAALQRCDSASQTDAALAAEAPARRMLAVLQFSEDDDMAFTLDRMFTLINPMRARLASGKCFLRFVVIEDQEQRRSICSALNQWMLSSAEKASGLPAAFSSSVELTTAGAPASSASLSTHNSPAHLIPDSGASKNLHCPQPFPSGF